MSDYRSELDAWTDMWDDAQLQGIHPSAEPPKVEKTPSTGKAQDLYYDYLDETETEQLLQEVRTPNPVYPDTIGPDHTTTPPVWASEDLLKEVESLKQKLFDLENKMAQLGGDKKWTEKALLYSDDDKKLMSDVELLKKKLEQVSSVLGIKHEPSPWDTKQVKHN